MVVFGLFLYVVKLLRDPTRFTYPDELAHSYNVNSIVSTHALFGANPVLPLTSRYPGLETATAAVRLAGGASTFLAGVSMIAIARLLLMLALFLLLERITSSASVAGLAALLYTANPNFLFFDSQFSYESLALPLAVVAAFAIVRWLKLKEADMSSPEPRRLWPRYAWGAVAIALIVAVVLTHHGTSYVLVAFIFAVGRAQREIRRLWKSYVSPLAFAAFALVTTLAWLIYAARPTWDYLSPVFSDAIQSGLNMLDGHQGARQLFSSTGGPGQQDVTPLWDRLVALTAAGMIAAALPFGLRRIWKDRRTDAVTLVLAVASAAYVVSLGLRLVPNAWEIANRASEFLFIGVGLVLAIVGLERWWPNRGPRLGRIAVAVAFAVLLEGGIVAGWSSNVVLGQTDAVAVGDTTIRPQGLVVTRWAQDVLGPRHRFAADASNARLLAAYADEFAISGTNPDVQAVIRESKLEGWHVRLLARLGIQYVLVDKRRVSEDELSGAFFANASSPPSWRRTFPARSVHMFDRQRSVSRLLDSGNIVVYDVVRLTRNAS